MDPAAISRREWLLAMVLLAAGVAGSVLPLVLQQAAWLNMVHPVWGVLLVAGAIAVVWLRPATPVRYPLIMTLVSAYAVCIAQLGAFRVAAPAYDLHDASHQVARLQAAGREVASVTRYHGQFGFYGRLVRPIVQLEAGEVLSWAARHPDDFLVLTAGDIPESGLPEALHVQAYRGGYLAILEGRGLLNEPAVLP
jgi:hypothetical protein